MVAQVKKIRKTGKEVNVKGKMWIPVEDRVRVRREGMGLQDYWLDCWQTDPFGNRWTLMCFGEEATKEIKNTTKAKYRKQLKAMKMFEFENREGDDGRSLWVRNLHGSKALDQIEQTLDTVEKSLDGVEQKLDQIERVEAETFTATGLENPSISIQYQIKNTSTALPDSAAVLSFSSLNEEDLSSNPQSNPSGNPSIASKTQQVPDPSINPQPTPSPKLTDLQTNPATKISVLNDNPRSGQKIPPPPRHTLPQTDTQSTIPTQKPLQAASPIKTSNPTPTHPLDCLDVFSPDLDESLMQLTSALEKLGRLDEFKDVLALRPIINSKPTQVAIDAIDHVTEKLAGIKVLGAYMRKALEDTYKPSGVKVTTQIEDSERIGTSASRRMVNVSVKPAPKALEEFLSEENLSMFLEAHLEDKFLHLCVSQLFMEWDKGDELHRSRISYWRGSQKMSRVKQK